MAYLRKLTTAAVLAGLVASGMMLGTARLEAKGKGGSGDPKEAFCSALLAVITYQYVSPTIKEYVTGLYLAYGCDPSKLS